MIFWTLRQFKELRLFESGVMLEEHCPDCNYRLDFTINRDGTGRLFCPYGNCTYEGRDITGKDWDLEIEEEII